MKIQMLYSQEGKKSFKLFLLILNAVKVNLNQLNLAVAFGVFGAFSEAISLFFIIPTVNLIIGSPNSAGYHLAFLPSNPSHQLLLLVFVTIFFAILKYVLFYVSTYRSLSLANLIDFKVRAILFKKYLSFGKLYFDRRKLSDVTSVIDKHVTSAANLIVKTNNFVLDLILLIIHLCLMLVISPKITMAIILVIPTLSLFFRKYITQLSQVSKKKFELDARVSNNITEVLNGFVLVKTYDSLEGHAAELSKIYAEDKSLTIQYQSRMALIWPLREMAGLTVLLFVILYVYFVDTSLKQEVAAIGLYAIILRRIGGKLAVVNDINASFASMLTPLQKIHEVLTEVNSEKVKSGNLVFKGLNKEICFEDVGFYYEAARPLFYNLNLIIGKGKTTAIVGESGAGKSTLVNLLMRLYDPVSGKILVDGVDCAQYDFKSWADHFSIVTQEPVIFSSTLKDNIVYGLKSYSENDLLAAVRSSRLNDLIEHSPLGLNMLLGDKGVMLSQGEKQRVAIARAFLKNASILILDEPNSSLDAETEADLQKSIDLLCKDKTVIIIAHRLSSIKNADNLIFLKNGRVLEQGAPKNLLENPRGYFSNYWKIQSL